MMSMLSRKRYVWRLVLAAVLMLTVFPQGVSHADGACTATINPTSVGVTSATTFTVSIVNSGSVDIQWVDITVPTSFTYGGNYVYDWAGSDHGNGATFTNNTLGQGQTANFDLAGTAGLRPGSSNNWLLQVSDDPGGANPATCTGNLQTTVSGHPPYDTASGVSGIVVSGITTTGVTVTWETDAAMSSLVYYGTTGNYGSTSAYNSNLEMSHSVVLSGLSAGTGYHFQVAGDDGQGGFAYSSDNTFVTASAPVVPGGGGGGTGGSGTGGGGGTGTTSPPVTTPSGVPTESTPPSIEFTSKLTGTHKTPPRLEGRAADNDAIAKVEYSIDGGKNWIAADSVTQAAVTTTTGKGKKKKTTTTTDAKNVSFAFTPVILEDGNYEISARATDLSGNQASTPIITLVIDRLPPRFGPSVVTIGPQMIEPAADGTLVLPAGLDYKISLSLIGGPTTVTIRAQAGAEKERSFSLTRLGQAGLWAGILSFSTPGRYQLTGDAVDGAGNTAKRALATVVVAPPVQVTGDAADLKTARVTLYSLSPETHDWQIWNGAAYGQQNPRSLDAKNAFSALVPAGEYYMKLSVAGKPDTLTRSFKVDQPTPLTGALALERPVGFKLGPISLFWPWTKLAAPPIKAVSSGGNASAGVINARLPLVALPTTAGASVTPVDWYGKPTVLASVATWAPTTAEQLSVLQKLSANPDVNVVVVAGQQRAETVAAYLQVAGSTLGVVCDPDGLLSGTLTVPGIPALYFIDRHGIIKKVMVGTRSADTILSELGRL